MVPDEQPAESGPGQPATGGEGSPSETQPEAAPEGGSPVPESAGPVEAPVEEAAAPPTQPVDPTPAEPPKAGLPTAPASKPKEASGSPSTGSVTDELVDLGNEALDVAKSIARGTLKAALHESRDFVGELLKDRGLSTAEKEEVKRLYSAAEKHALMGKVAVAHAMGKRLDNFIKSNSVVGKSARARASQNYLTGLLRLATGAVSTFFGTFGKPLVDKLTDIGLKATDEFLQ